MTKKKPGVVGRKMTEAEAWKAYKKALAPAREAYEKACAPAVVAYEKATAPAWKAYKAYLKALDEADS